MLSLEVLVLSVAILFGHVSEAQDCGMAPLNTKVVGGQDAQNGSWPWQVSMHYVPWRAHVCGGTLINNQWVLTAAHCMVSMAPSDWTMYMGRQAQEGFNPNEVQRSVSKIVVHPEYNNSIFNNDITLMQLSSPVNFTDYIRPVCLAASSTTVHTNTNCWISGWGNIGAGAALGSPQNLQEVEIPVVGNKQCTCQYRPINVANITSNMICAGQENKGACQGDSGGPLQCNQGSAWIQVGITSYGVPCATGVFAEVYARVSEYNAWITANIDGASVEFRTFTSSGIDPDSSFLCANAGATTPATIGTPTDAATISTTTDSATVGIITDAATINTTSAAQHAMFLLLALYCSWGSI